MWRHKFLYLILLTIVMVSSCRREADMKSIVYRDITSVDKLVLAKMSINKIGEYNDDSNWKIGKRIAVYSYNTYLQAYIDLSSLTPDDVTVNEKTGDITLILPPVQTEWAGRDMAMREEHYRVTGLRSRIGPRERAELKESMNASLKQEVEKDVRFREMLEESARKKATLYFTSLMGQQGYSVNVSFRKK